MKTHFIILAFVCFSPLSKRCCVCVLVSLTLSHKHTGNDDVSSKRLQNGGRCVDLIMAFNSYRHDRNRRLPSVRDNTKNVLSFFFFVFILLLLFSSSPKVSSERLSCHDSFADSHRDCYYRWPFFGHSFSIIRNSLLFLGRSPNRNCATVCCPNFFHFLINSRHFFFIFNSQGLSLVLFVFSL